MPPTDRAHPEPNDPRAPQVQALLQQHLPGLRAFMRLNSGRLLRSKESCSDLVQSACREVLENAEQFAFGGEEGFRRWLYRAAMRKIAHRAEYWRAEMRDVQREQHQDDDATESTELLASYQAFYTPSQQAVAREELLRVEAAFDGLPEAHRQVIVMAKILGMSRAEIAAELGRTELAVRTLLSRALAQLAQRLV